MSRNLSKPLTKSAVAVGAIPGISYGFLMAGSSGGVLVGKKVSGYRYDIVIIWACDSGVL